MHQQTAVYRRPSHSLTLRRAVLPAERLSEVNPADGGNFAQRLDDIEGEEREHVDVRWLPNQGPASAGRILAVPEDVSL